MVIWELALCGGSVALALALAAFARLLYCERLRRGAGAAAIVLLRERCRRHRAWLGLLPSLRPCIPPFPSVLSSQPIACQLVQNSHPASSVLSGPLKSRDLLYNYIFIPTSLAWWAGLAAPGSSPPRSLSRGAV